MNSDTVARPYWKPLGCSNSDEVSRYLVTTIQRSRISTLVGLPGSGKTFLTRPMTTDGWWHTQEPRQNAPALVYAELSETEGTQSVLAHLLTEIALGLSTISARRDDVLVHAQKDWFNKMHGTATTTQLTTLFGFIRKECQRLRVRGVIIDNATLLDVSSLKRLVQLRKHFSQQFALLFCVQTNEEGAHSAYFSRMLSIALAHDEYERPIELRRPARKEVTGTILHTFMENLNCTYDMKLWTKETITTMREQWWNATQGNWHQIMQYWRRADDLFGTRTVKQWLIKPNEWGHLMQA